MRLIAILMLVFTGCASAAKTTYDRCARASYIINAEYCGSSPNSGCDPTNMVFACDVIKF